MKTLVLLVNFSLTAILLLSVALSIARQRQESISSANMKTYSTPPAPPAVLPAGIVLNFALPLPTKSPQLAFDHTYGDFGSILNGTTQDVLATSSAAQTLTPSLSPTPKSDSKSKSSQKPSPRLSPTPPSSPSDQTTASANLTPSRQPVIKPLVIPLPVETTPLPDTANPTETSRFTLVTLGVGAAVLTLVGVILVL